jgi:lipoprotein-anchoring transpeptidase ErfK/SrfK
LAYNVKINCGYKGDGITETVKQNKKPKKIIIGIAIFFFTILITYLGMTVYFMNHFYFGSEINSISVSGKRVEEVEEKMASELQSYSLNLKERGGKNEEIKASDIGLKFNSEGQFNKLKAEQNAFKWVSSVFNKEGYKMTDEISFDEKLLKEKVDKLSCFDTSNVVEPKNASLKFEGKAYVIVSEVNGNKINKDILYEYVANAILKKESVLDLESINCYINPQNTSNSPNIIEAKDMLNKYLSSKITYTFGERKETLDYSIINKWLTVDNNFIVTFDEEKVKEFVQSLSKKYNTVGRTRTFVTSSRRTIRISGGDYGWRINPVKEAQALSTSIKEGQTVTKEPAYSRAAFFHGGNNRDIGNTYVEIDLTKQHLWFYKNGSLIAQGNVVTGNVSKKNSTPRGIYGLKYKQKDAVLKGEDYETKVSFWMPFNGGIGIHDAIWRSSFGGKIYMTNGSHGCVNSPYNVARTVFYNIKPGTPVICY